MVSPYSTGASPDDQGWWAERIVKRFFNAPDPEGAQYGDAVVFAAACTVASIVGYLVQQFIIGTGIAKVAGKIADVTGLAKKLTQAGKSLSKTVDKVRDVARGAKDFLRGTAEAMKETLEAIGQRIRKGMQGAIHCAARLGLSGNCEKFAKFVGRRLGPEFADEAFGVCTNLCKHASGNVFVHGLDNWFDDISEGSLAVGKAASRHADNGDIVLIRSARGAGPDLKVVRPDRIWDIEVKAFLEAIRAGFKQITNRIDDALKQFRTRLAGHDGVINLDLHKGLDNGVTRSGLENHIRMHMFTDGVNTRGFVNIIDVVYPDGTVRRATLAGGWNDWVTVG